MHLLALGLLLGIILGKSFFNWSVRPLLNTYFIDNILYKHYVDSQYPEWLLIKEMSFISRRCLKLFLIKN